MNNTTERAATRSFSLSGLIGWLKNAFSTEDPIDSYAVWGEDDEWGDWDEWEREVL